MNEVMMIDQEERFVSIIRQLDVRGLEFVVEFLPFCIERLNAGDSSSEQIMTAWNERQALRKEGDQE